MTEQDVKNHLLNLYSNIKDFQVVFSGKESRRVDGLYHPDTCEITIHNKNFTDDNSLMYTAIHEFTHHFVFTRYDPEERPKTHHSNLFWDIFHRLLQIAVQKGIYKNIYDEDERFRELTKKIQEEFIQKNGELMKALGKTLVQALDLCQQKHAIFEDYIERELGLNRVTAKAAMKMFVRDVDPSLGYDRMKMVAALPEPKAREEVTQSFKEGKTQNQVRGEIQEMKEAKRKPRDEYVLLKKRFTKLEDTIYDLNLELDVVLVNMQQIEKERGLPLTTTDYDESYFEEEEEDTRDEVQKEEHSPTPAPSSQKEEPQPPLDNGGIDPYYPAPEHEDQGDPEEYEEQPPLNDGSIDPHYRDPDDEDQDNPEDYEDYGQEYDDPDDPGDYEGYDSDYDDPDDSPPFPEHQEESPPPRPRKDTPPCPGLVRGTEIPIPRREHHG